MVGYVHKCSKHLKAALGNGLQKNSGTGLVYKNNYIFLSGSLQLSHWELSVIYKDKLAN